MKPAANAFRDETLVNRVRKAFTGVSNVKEKQMFGSTAFMVSDKMCISARAERIMCRIDPSLHDKAVERKGCQTVVMGGRQYRGYVYVGAEFVKTSPDLKYWIDLVLSYNRAQKKTKKLKRPSKPAALKRRG